MINAIRNNLAPFDTCSLALLLLIPSTWAALRVTS